MTKRIKRQTSKPQRTAVQILGGGITMMKTHLIKYLTSGALVMSTAGAMLLCKDDLHLGLL